MCICPECIADIFRRIAQLSATISMCIGVGRRPNYNSRPAVAVADLLVPVYRQDIPFGDNIHVLPIALEQDRKGS